MVTIALRRRGRRERIEQRLRLLDRQCPRGWFLFLGEWRQERSLLIRIAIVRKCIGDCSAGHDGDGKPHVTARQLLDDQHAGDRGTLLGHSAELRRNTQQGHAHGGGPFEHLRRSSTLGVGPGSRRA